MTELPPAVEQLLLDVVADGFTVYCCGPRTGPMALAASYEWDDYVDHLTIRSCDLVAAARFPKLARWTCSRPRWSSGPMKVPRNTPCAPC